ncbi:hypothetical protein TL18_00255 [Methanobrevibacter sp. YE315]|uniref:hypothetical protein n=1 Tax=Methanobrevibacter sp. YE315 TaxID=1609968 RepID=UPI000764E602|nr:hypothetical protein [Methanobrevibacter sp. YE315]AMD16603.1 hypothetical protein TL18_00255 [Methanobrevibacter sp. YE315]
MNYKQIIEILKDFKVKKIIFLGCNSENLMKYILSYTQINCGELIFIDSQPKINIEEIINDYTNVNFTFYNEDSLNKLTNFKDYDAIFIDDNPNWYTVYNELNIIEKNCDKFPLIFICNSIFPNERRDTYYHFNNIPFSYQNTYEKKLRLYDDLVIDDEFYHAIYQNTPKNGVLTAVEDYIENSELDIGKTLIDCKTGILLIYFKNHHIFKKYYNNKNLNNEFINFHVKHTLLKNIVKNSLAEDSDDYFKNDTDYINKELLIEIRENNEELNDLLRTKINRINDLKKERRILNKTITEKDKQITQKDKLIRTKIDRINDLKKERRILNYTITEKDKQITRKNKQTTQKDKLIRTKIDRINDLKKERRVLNKTIKTKDKQLKYKNKKLHYNKRSINLLSSKRRFSILLSQFYIIFKFKYGAKLKLNRTLFNEIIKNNWLDVGFYFKNNRELSEFKWFKLLTPEAHYVCHGYDEKRIPKLGFDDKLKKEGIIKEITGDAYDK